MAERGAPLGNDNATRGCEWRDAIRRALAKKGRGIEGNAAAFRKGLDAVAEKFVEAASNGDAWAMKELGDRTDGRAVQAVELTGANGGSVDMKWTVEVIEAGQADE